MTRSTSLPKALALSVTLWSSGLLSATPAAATPSDEDFARLQKQVEDQRRLTLQLMKVEQQHYDLLLELIQGSSRPPGPAAATPGAPSAPGGTASAMPDGEPATPSPSSSSPGTAPAAPAPPRRVYVERTAAVTGKVQLPGSGGEVYVFVQNARTSAARNRSVTIEQKDKQFVPAVAVVQRGTTVTFPNRDAVFHNVFSPTMPHPFDLGSYRAGDTPRSIALTASGVVIDVFCNIHSGMRAQILVVPNSLYTRVSSDGSFRIDNVPIGARKLVVWGPNVKMAQQMVEVAPNGADVRFALAPEAAKPHNNKVGQPYGSYKE